MPFFSSVLLRGKGCKFVRKKSCLICNETNLSLGRSVPSTELWRIFLIDDSILFIFSTFKFETLLHFFCILTTSIIKNLLKNKFSLQIKHVTNRIMHCSRFISRTRLGWKIWQKFLNLTCGRQIDYPDYPSIFWIFLTPLLQARATYVCCRLQQKCCN